MPPKKSRGKHGPKAQRAQGGGKDAPFTGALSEELRGHYEGVITAHCAPGLWGMYQGLTADLQQQLMHVAVGFLDLVEQDHTVGRSQQRVRERAAVLMADVAGWGADDPRDRVKAALRSWFDPSFSDVQHLEMWLAIWAVSRTNEEVAAAERDLYDQCAGQLNAAIADVDSSLSPDKVSRRVTDLLALQNGLWINWNRWADDEALERGLKLCEAIAFGDLQ